MTTAAILTWARSEPSALWHGDVKLDVQAIHLDESEELTTEEMSDEHHEPGPSKLNIQINEEQYSFKVLKTRRILREGQPVTEVLVADISHCPAMSP